MTNPIVDPQNAMRFDFTKSAICRRFCKVRLLKHPTGMFYPLRMTRSISFCSIILYLLIRHPIRMPPSPQEKAFLYLLFRLRIVWSVVQFCFQYQEAFLTLLFERYLCTEPSPAEKGNRLRWMRRYRKFLQDIAPTCHPERIKHPGGMF